jgi:hypothetical protein
MLNLVVHKATARLSECMIVPYPVCSFSGGVGNRFCKLKPSRFEKLNYLLRRSSTVRTKCSKSPEFWTLTSCFCAIRFNIILQYASSFYQMLFLTAFPTKILLSFLIFCCSCYRSAQSPLPSIWWVLQVVDCWVFCACPVMLFPIYDDTGEIV